MKRETAPHSCCCTVASGPKRLARLSFGPATEPGRPALHDSLGRFQEAGELERSPYRRCRSELRAERAASDAGCFVGLEKDVHRAGVDEQSPGEVGDDERVLFDQRLEQRSQRISSNEVVLAREGCVSPLPRLPPPPPRVMRSPRIIASPGSGTRSITASPIDLTRVPPAGSSKFHGSAEGVHKRHRLFVPVRLGRREAGDVGE